MHLTTERRDKITELLARHPTDPDEPGEDESATAKDSDYRAYDEARADIGEEAVDMLRSLTTDFVPYVPTTSTELSVHVHEEVEVTLNYGPEHDHHWLVVGSGHLNIVLHATPATLLDLHRKLGAELDRLSTIEAEAKRAAAL